jgi:hypothetical protein
MYVFYASLLAISTVFISLLSLDAFHVNQRTHARLMPKRVRLLHEYQYQSHYYMTKDLYGIESMDDEDDEPSEGEIDDESVAEGDENMDKLDGPATGQFKLGKKKLPTILQGEPLKPPPFRQRRPRATSLTDNLIIVGTTIVTLSILVAGFLFVNKDLNDRPLPGSKDPMSRL